MGPSDGQAVSDSIQRTRHEEAYLLPDTHTHLDADDFRDDFEAMVSRARIAGVDRILTVGEDLGTSRRAVELSHEYDIIYAAVGIHPQRADKFDEERREVERLLEQEKVVAVGEIGLDWIRGSAPRDIQIQVFRAQLGWAAERGLPVSVHNRGADGEVLEALHDAPVTAVLHCFDGPWEIAGRAVAAGHFVSFAGNITFPKSDELRGVAQRIPPHRLLVETDSPVMSPQGRRGKRNEPAQIIETAALIASLRGTPLPDLAVQLSRNANDVFGWSSR